MCCVVMVALVSTIWNVWIHHWIGYQRVNGIVLYALIVRYVSIEVVTFYTSNHKVSISVEEL